jgi:hypothetical protein
VERLERYQWRGTSGGVGEVPVERLERYQWRGTSGEVLITVMSIEPHL